MLASATPQCHFFSVNRAKWVKVDGIMYKSATAIVTDVKDDYPVFVKIDDVFVVGN